MLKDVHYLLTLLILVWGVGLSELIFFFLLLFQVEADRITHEIQKKREKEGKEIEQEKHKKLVNYAD